MNARPFVWAFLFFDSNRAKKMPNNLETGKKPYLCTAFEQILGYGVMVTLQILVLPFLVRVRVAQPRE